MLTRFWSLKQQGHLQPHSKSKACKMAYCMTACADMFLLTLTHSEVFDVVQLHDSGTTPFKKQSI